MQVPEISSIVNDCESGMNFLQNPSLISRFISLSSIKTAPELHSLCKWGTLILALLATFTTIFHIIKLFVIRVPTIQPLISSSDPLLQFFHDDDDLSEDDTSSSSSLEDEECESTSSFEDQIEEDFRASGSSFYSENQWKNSKFKLRRCGSFGTDFVPGKSVVKLWDNLGLRLESEDSFNSNGVISIWDLNKDKKISSFFGGRRQFPVVVMSSPAGVFSAGMDERSNAVVLGVHDTRMGRQIPAIYAEWTPLVGKLVSLTFGDVEKVYVINDVTDVLTVGDMRNVKVPLEKV